MFGATTRSRPTFSNHPIALFPHNEALTMAMRQILWLPRCETSQRRIDWSTNCSLSAKLIQVDRLWPQDALPSAGQGRTMLLNLWLPAAAAARVEYNVGPIQVALAQYELRTPLIATSFHRRYSWALHYPFLDPESMPGIITKPWRTQRFHLAIRTMGP